MNVSDSNNVTMEVPLKVTLYPHLRSKGKTVIEEVYI